MATHSSVLAWRIPGTGKPGGLLSMGSHRVRHDWSDLAAADFPTNSLRVTHKRCTIQENKNNLFIGVFEFFLDILEIVAIVLNRFRRLNYIIS